jgi:hypothetical protein
MSVLVGCSAPKGLVKGNGISSSEVAVFSALPSFNRDAGYLSANVRMTATVNGESASTKGKLRIRRGEGVQVSATAMGLMEAACFEFLPDVLRFIYKIDKIYAEAPYGGVPFLYNTGTDYRILESVILNRMFSPDGRPFRTALADMEIAQERDYITVTTSRASHVVYKFYIDRSNGNLVKSKGDYANGGNVVCIYSDFVDFDGKPFPQKAEISFSGDGISAALTLKMSSLRNGEFSFSPRRVSKAYERISLEAILESMGNME